MGEYRDGKWHPTFGDVQAGISDWAPGEGRFDTEGILRKQLQQQADEIERLQAENEKLKECIAEWQKDSALNGRW